MFEDTKGVIRIRISKNNQCNGQKTKTHDKRTNKDLTQSIDTKSSNVYKCRLYSFKCHILFAVFWTPFLSCARKRCLCRSYIHKEMTILSTELLSFDVKFTITYCCNSWTVNVPKWRVCILNDYSVLICNG